MLPIESLKISNFRMFTELEIPHCGRLNLIVGKNSVGKTSLLEAIRIFVGRGVGKGFHDVLASRGEIREAAGFPAEDFGLGLFERQAGPTGGFSIASGDSTIRVTSFLELDGQRYVQNVHGKTPKRVFKVANAEGGELQLFSDQLRASEWREDTLRPCILVGAKGLTTEDIATMWTSLALTEAESELNSLMREAFPEIERVAVIPHNGVLTLRVKLQRNEFPVPLSGLGEGANRVFGLAVAMMRVRNGVLLIDEIETGIHYSIQQKVWEFLSKTAHTLNVQIFGTTHSADTVHAFTRACVENQDVDGTILSLRMWRNSIVVAHYDESEMEFAEDSNKELR